MIENDRELRAAQDWLRYWKSIVADGEQSWLGREDARAELMRYSREIADYERRRARSGGAPGPNSQGPERTTGTS